MKKICIVGAGASGLMAALSAVKNGGKVTVFEGKEEAGKKILRTGNGKCNFSNSDMSYEYFNTDSPDFVKNCLERFDENELSLCFSRMGMLIRDKEGYLYPYNEQAKTVRDLLVNELKSYGVEIKTNSYVNMITKEANGSFLVSVEGVKERLVFDRVIVATGGKAGLLKKDRQNGYELLNKLGISSTALYPGLTRLVCTSDFSENIDGVRMNALATLFIENELTAEQFGEVLFRKDGISGICIFILSSYCKKALSEGKKVSLKLDLLPDIDEESLTDYLNARFLINSDKSAEDYFTGLFPDKINSEIIRINNLPSKEAVSKLSSEKINRIILSLKNFRMKVTDTADFDSAQVTVGGIPTEELTSYCECKKIPGLFVTGELINVDGPCGGYNLQWAFTTGSIAGEKACS